jgi:hypothetical protein
MLDGLYTRRHQWHTLNSTFFCIITFTETPKKKDAYKRIWDNNGKYFCQVSMRQYITKWQYCSIAYTTSTFAPFSVSFGLAIRGCNISGDKPTPCSTVLLRSQAEQPLSWSKHFHTWTELSGSLTFSQDPIQSQLNPVHLIQNFDKTFVCISGYSVAEWLRHYTTSRKVAG